MNFPLLLLILFSGGTPYSLTPGPGAIQYPPISMNIAYSNICIRERLQFVKLLVLCVNAAAIQEQLGMMKNGEGGLSIFLGLNGTKEELGLDAQNYWVFAENNYDEL